MHAGGDWAAAAAADAYEAMYALYQPRLVTHCRRRLWNEADAEDAAHETLLRAYRALPDFDPSSDAWPWLTTIASRICTDLRRRATRTPSAPGPERQGADVHEEVVGRLRADILDDALRQLPARYRTPLLLREYARWSYDDIARVQGKSVGSIRSLLARGRRRLEAHVESIARSRGQWPLPGVVPPVRRLRDQLRAWRDSLVRSPHAVLGALEVSVVTRWAAGADAALATVLTVTTAALAAVHPATAAESAPAIVSSLTTPVTWQIRGPDVRQLTTPEAAVSTHVAPATATRETLTRVDATTPVPQRYNPGLAAGVGVEVDASAGVLWVEHSYTVTVPGVIDRTRVGTTNVTCNKNKVKTVACEAAKQTLDSVPEG